MNKEIVTIVTMATGVGYREMMSECMESKKHYAEKNGINYVEGDEQLINRQRPISWSKVVVVRNILIHSCTNWVLWIDADTLITNYNFNVYEIIKNKDHINKNFIFSADPISVANCGVWLAKNTDWSIKFLELWYKYGLKESGPYWEQSTLDNLLHMYAFLNQRISILPQRRLNSFFGNITNKNKEKTWQKGDFLVHFAGKRKANIRQVIEKYFKEYIVCL